jgi:hypothetical protein
MSAAAHLLLTLADELPPNALTLDGDPITYEGENLTYTEPE